MDKTCGNCGKFALEPFKQRSGACMGSFDRDSCSYHSTSIHRDESNCPWCSGWIPKQDPIEQSFQQLAEVARELYRDLERVTDKRLDRSRRENMLEAHFNKLYDLGVKL